MTLLFPAPDPVTIPVEGQGDLPVRRIFCVGRNYAAHAAEMGTAVDTDAPFFFLKSAHAVLSRGADLPYPPGTEDLHHEVELAVALGEGGKPVAAGVSLDMTRRDLQATAKSRRQPWDIGKDFEGAAIFAPMRLAAEIPVGAIRLWVNDTLRQDGHTRDMVRPVPELLDHLARYYTLMPGDILMTGTPSGVAAVSPGDRIRAVMEGLPELALEVAPRG